MPIICRLLQIPRAQAALLAAAPAQLEETVKSAKIYSGVYRYWHGIEYLLHNTAQNHQPPSGLAWVRPSRLPRTQSRQHECFRLPW
jgi:hypothetical protein